MTSKRMFISVLIVAMCIAFSGYAFADNSAAAGADAASVLIDESTEISNNPRQHTNAYVPGAPGFLPPLYKDEGWKIWTNPYFTQNGMTWQQIKAMRKASLKQWPTVWGTMKGIYNLDETTEILDTMPTGKYDEQLGFFTVRGRADANIEEAVAEAIYQAKIGTYTKRVLILVKGKLITNGKVYGLGSATTAAKMVGPSGEVDKIAGAVTGGGIYTRAKSWVDDQPYVKVIAFNSEDLGNIGKEKPKPKKRSRRFEDQINR